MTALALVDLSGLSRTDWLEARRQGLGGSDAPAIAGLDRFRSATTVYFDKLGELAEEDESDAMKWGNRLEQPIADEFEDRNGYIVTKAPALYQSLEHPYMLANPDRLLHTPELIPAGGLEIKTSRLDEDWRDDPPARVIIQVQHYMAVMGWARMYVAVLLHGRNYEQWVIERDDELIGLLVDAEGDFWQRVLDRRPPPTDGHPSTTSTLGQLYRRAREGSTLELPPEAEELLVELTLAKRAEKDAKDDVAALSNAVKALLGEHEVGTLGGELVVSWKAGKARARKHSCPDCTHAPDGPPSRTFLPREVTK